MAKDGKHISLHEAADEIMAVLDAERRGGRSSTEATGERSSGPGIGTWVAERLGIPPALAVAGGKRGYAAMMALQHARDAGDGGLRQQHLVQAQRHIAKLDPAHHGRLLQHLQGCVVALGGRRGDTHIAHVTPGETVLPESMLTPEVIALLQRTAREQGLDPARFQVGSGRNSINPQTGQMEFDDPMGQITVTANRPPLTPWDGFAKGALNRAYGGAQSYMNWRGQTDPSDAMVGDQLGKDITERQQIYDTRRKAAGQSGPDFWQDLGERVVTAPMDLAVGKLGGPIGNAAWEGAKSLLEPEVNVKPEDFWARKRQNALINAGGSLAEDSLAEMWKKSRQTTR